MGDISPTRFFLVYTIGTALSIVVFLHADKRGNRHATAWGIATFLFAGVVFPLYFWRHWRSRRRGRR